MALFRRRPPEMSVSAITDFWAWWRDGGEAQITVAQNAGDMGTIARQLSKRFDRIMPDLDWEMGPGKTATHSLRLSAGGIPPLRVAVQRWLRAAPSANETWEFAGSRERMRLQNLDHVEMDGYSFNPGRTTFAVEVNKDRRRVSVVAYNSVYPTLPPGAALHFTSLSLEWILGEDEVVRWIGDMDVSMEPLPDAIDAAALREVVSSVALTDDDHWAIVHGRMKSGYGIVGMMRVGARWIDHAHLDLHNEISISYPESIVDSKGNRTGLPPAEASERLSKYETELLDLLGTRAIHLGHTSCENEFFVHVYTDSEDQNTSEIVRSWARAQPNARVKQTQDPSWRRVAHFIG